MVPIIAAALTFLLLAGAGIAWAVRRDEARRASGKRTAGSGVDDSGPTIAYAASADGHGYDAGDGGSADCGGDGGSADCGGSGD